LGKLKIYTDENVDVRIAEGLRRRGVDAVSAREKGALGINDEEHFEKFCPVDHLTSKWSIVPYFFFHPLFTLRKFLTGLWYQTASFITKDLWSSILINQSIIVWASRTKSLLPSLL